MDIETKTPTPMDSEDDVNKRYARELKIIKLIVILACEIYVKNREGDQFASWMKFLREIFEDFAPGAVWFIKYLTKHVKIINILLISRLI